MTAFLAAVAGGLALCAWAWWTYRQREIAVPGRPVLVGLRSGALLLVLLLLLDPRLPAAGRTPATWLLLDASASMERPGVAGAAEQALAERGDLPVLAFGGGSPADTSVREGPRDGRLTPALEAAAGSGAVRVVVVTDLRLEDPQAARAAAERLGLDVEVVDVDAPVRSAAVRSFRLPSAVPPVPPADQGIEATITVAATGVSDGDSATVEVREEGGLVASERAELPGPGREIRLEVGLPRPSGTGAVRYEARVVLEGDGWSADDARVAWTEVDPVGGALVLVSPAPDWEPRFLLPVLEEVTGLRTRGLLGVGEGRWLAMEPGGAAATVPDERAAREVREAELLVVHGGGAGPAWLAEAVDAAPRVLVLASNPADAALAGLETAPRVGGEWYASPDVPPSPIAAELSGASLEGLPPLSPVLPLREAAGVTVPLRVRRGAGGGEEAALAFLSEPDRRRAVSLAPGHWRWAFRSPAGRDAYRRLWAGVAGWLLAGGGTGGGAPRPVDRVVAEGEPVAWTAGSAVGDTVSLTLTRGDSVGRDTTLVVPETGRFTTGPLAPGTWSWTVRAGDAEATGRLDVDGWSGEVLHPRAEALAGTAASGPGRAATAGGGDGGRPLRTHPLPYLLVLSLLCAEWILRRRRGLR